MSGGSRLGHDVMHLCGVVRRYPCPVRVKAALEALFGWCRVARALIVVG
jgi:hypothetical protein